MLRRRVILMLGALVGLAACGGTFRTSFPAAVPAGMAKGWRLADVRVAVPESLQVSEARSILPRADIVWREDPPGDRRAQVARIVGDAIREAGAGMHGPRPVRIEVTMSRFHALTFEAESRNWAAGVHDIEMTAQVVDAATGQVLFGPSPMEASLPALAGAEMAAARARGETQKSQITAHLVRTFRGWLGIGPDPRDSFNRPGG